MFSPLVGTLLYHLVGSPKHHIKQYVPLHDIGLMRCPVHLVVLEHFLRKIRGVLREFHVVSGEFYYHGVITSSIIHIPSLTTNVFPVSYHSHSLELISWNSDTLQNKMCKFL